MEILNQWLEELAGDLQRISPEDREAILESYREQINEMVSCGIKESDILSEIGSPKQVAKEVLESFIVDEALEEEVNVWKGPSRETNRGKQLFGIAVMGICLFIACWSFLMTLRLVIGGFFISLISLGLMIALFFAAIVAFNLTIASGYVGWLVWNREKRERVRKKGIERYLIISSVVAIIVGSAVFVGSIYTNPFLKQGVSEGELFDLIEERSQGILDFDDLFEIDFS